MKFQEYYRKAGIIWKAVTALSEHFSLFAVVYLISLWAGFI